MNDLQKKLLTKIKNGEIEMTPRWRMVLRSVLWSSVLVVAVLVAVYILSFILFTLHQTGVWFAPQFGWNGMVLLIVSSPWILITALLFFLVILYVLVSQYSFSYRKPLVYSLVGVVLVVVAVSSFIQQLAVHDRIQKFADRHDVPGIGRLYRGVADHVPPEVTIGEVTKREVDHFMIINGADESVMVKITEATKLPRGREVAVGDRVMVFGSEVSGEIRAFGVRFDDTMVLPLHVKRNGREVLPQAGM